MYDLCIILAHAFTHLNKRTQKYHGPSMSFSINTLGSLVGDSNIKVKSIVDDENFNNEWKK